MPRNNDLHKILLIGSGPIVIGQGCEFDYSGVQACKALREEGYEVVLVNSNPATIMTDPEFADRTYIEPITPEVIEAILEREKPDAILPTMGGQTALERGHGTEPQRRAGAARRPVDRRERAGHRQRAKTASCSRKRCCGSASMFRAPGSRIRMADASRVADAIGKFPLIIRPAFTLGGSGGGIAYNRDELDEIVERGLALSPVTRSA